MRYSFKSLMAVELVRLLGDEDEIVRAGAACELGRRGHRAASALAALVDMARLDPDGPARGAAAAALVALAAERVPGAVEAVRRSTRLGYYPLTARAAWVLERVEAAAERAYGDSKRGEAV